MPAPPSPVTHQRLLDSLPTITGRPVAEWVRAMDDAPGLVRFTERVAWLRSQHQLPHGHASAIVRECDLRRAERSLS